MYKARGIFSLVAVLIFSSANAEIYHCKNKDGSMSYKDSPCDYETVKVEQADTSKRNSSTTSNAIISPRDLKGTWTDYPEPNMKSFRTTWHFDGSIMTFRKYNGRIIKAAYTLTDDKLIVHHKKSSVNDGAWDEEMILKSYQDKVLVWESIARVKLHKIK